MQLNRLKIFYIALCLFFVVGAFVTAYVSGEQVEDLPDMSWQKPEYFVGYFNNYLNQKVNPMTLGDVFVTEYIEHPDEPTGVVPLYPTQAVIQERSMVNCSITEIETYLVPDDNNTYGTIVGIGLYVKRGESGRWELEKYDTVSTAGDGSQVIEVVIETPRITFDAEGGSIRIVITNFGTEINEAVYVPSVIDTSERSSFSGMNTIVDIEEALFLTIKNKYQMVKGYRYYVDYKRFVGLQLHKVAYKQDDKDIAINSNEIIAIFDYPTLIRKDSITNRYSNFRSLFGNFLNIVDPKLVTNIEEILVQIPIIGTFFKYKPYEIDLSYATTSQKSDINIQEYVDRLVESSQNNLEHASQPAIQTMLLSQNIDAVHPSDYYDLIEYFNHTFVSDYNELEKQDKFTFTQLDWKTFKLELSEQRQTEWVLDLTESMDTMITEINPIPGRDNLEHRSFRWLLNKLNGGYYSSKERGSTGIQAIKQRVETRFSVDKNSGENFKHLVKQVENIAVPNYNDLRVVTDPALGTFSLLNKEGIVVQKYDMINMQESAGKSVSLLTSQSEKIFLWLQKTFGPWSNLQVPDEQPAYEWRDFLYSMDDDRDGNELFLGGSTSNINSLAYNGIERPLDFTLQTEDTPRGWYRGDATINIQGE